MSISIVCFCVWTRRVDVVVFLVFLFSLFFFIKIVLYGEKLWSLGGILIGYVVVMSDINGVLLLHHEIKLRILK
jgi:hypothetical protein